MVDFAPAGRLLVPRYCTPTIATAMPAGRLIGMVSPQALRSKLRAPPAETRYCVNRILRCPSAVIAAVAEPAGQPGPPSPILPTLADAAAAGGASTRTMASAAASRPSAISPNMRLKADTCVSTELHVRAGHGAGNAVHECANAGCIIDLVG